MNFGTIKNTMSGRSEIILVDVAGLSSFALASLQLSLVQYLLKGADGVKRFRLIICCNEESRVSSLLRKKMLNFFNFLPKIVQNIGFFLNG